MSIIKRRKTSNYAQIHNNPLQGDLKDLRSVGLLSHIMSLPEDWTLYKTQLQSFYTRKNVDAGWKELAEKKYAIGFSCYKDGKKNYFYNVSDVPFNQDEFEEFVIDQIKGLQEQGFVIKSLDTMIHSNLVITEKITVVLSVQQSDFTKVPIVQYSENCTESTYTNKQDNKEINTNKNNYNCNFKKPLSSDKFRELLTNESNKFYTKFSLGRYSKKQWNTLIEKFVNDTIESERYINVPEDKIKGFAYKCLEKIANHNEYKRSEEFADYENVMYELTNINSYNKTNKKTSNFYNWLEN
jgi:hypothetical protein